LAEAGARPVAGPAALPYYAAPLFHHKERAAHYRHRAEYK